MGRITLCGRLGLSAAALFLSLAALNSATAEQLPIAKVEAMPNLPEPYALRDWRKAARDYDTLVFDAEKKGEHLPLVRTIASQPNGSGATFGIRAYVGDYRGDDSNFDVITTLGAVVAATFAGIDKQHQNGHDWVTPCRAYFSRANGEDLYLNNIGARSGGSFWYELLPNVLFYQLFNRYRDTPDMAEQFRTVADRWYEACRAMGGKTDPWTLPDFDHTAFNFATMKPFDGAWKEADAAAAIAWIELMAQIHTGDAKYLTGAKWALEWLDRRDKNPYYECLLPYGVYAAARANAELGQKHNLTKLLNWCMDGDNWRHWGVNVERWGKYDCAGLASSAVPNEGYAFPMNTYIMAGLLAPVARYDDRYARAIGKYILNVANASRFFYRDGLPAEQQTCYAWSTEHDPECSIAYEGLRQFAYKTGRVSRDGETRAGRRAEGDFTNTAFRDGKYEVLAETPDGTGAALEHVWEIPVTPGLRHTLVVWGHVQGEANSGYRFSVSDKSDGPYKEAFSIATSTDSHGWLELKPDDTTVFLKVESADRKAPKPKPGVLFIDDIYVDEKLPVTPYAMGDPLQHGWAKTDLGLYGSSFVGFLGAVVAPTNVERILRLDLTATESFRAKAYPTYLYFNPYKEQRTVQADAGTVPVDLYDAVTGQFIHRGVTGKVDLSIPADSAIITVLCPAGGTMAQSNGHTLCNEVIIDYNRGGR